MCVSVFQYTCFVILCQGRAHTHIHRSGFVDSKSSLATQWESEESLKSAVMTPSLRTQWQINLMSVSEQRAESGILLLAASFRQTSF